MHHHLPTARADDVEDAGALFGACHLRNEGIVSIHASSYLWEEGRRKGWEVERGRREERRKNPPELLVEEDPRLPVGALDHAQRRTAGWRRERKLMGCGNKGSQHRHEAGLNSGNDVEDEDK
jgi:hypothetical protein